MSDYAEPYPEMPDNLPPLPPKWSVTCKCQVAAGGPMVTPQCRIHAGPFGRETVKLRAEIERLTAQMAELRDANERWERSHADLDHVVGATIRALRERDLIL